MTANVTNCVGGKLYVWAGRAYSILKTGVDLLQNGGQTSTPVVPCHTKFQVPIP